MEIQLVDVIQAVRLQPGDKFVLDCPGLPRLHDEVVEVKTIDKVNLNADPWNVFPPSIHLMVRHPVYSRMAWSFRPTSNVVTVNVIGDDEFDAEDDEWISTLVEPADRPVSLGEEVDPAVDPFDDGDDEPAAPTKMRIRVR